MKDTEKTDGELSREEKKRKGKSKSVKGGFFFSDSRGVRINYSQQCPKNVCLIWAFSLRKIMNGDLPIIMT